MTKQLNQRIHEFLGSLGLIRYTKCLERGCSEYHGNSPSQLITFYQIKEIEYGRNRNNGENK